ncbi:SDR family oxidoreductase [Paraburkholderia hospita]|uniref:SDR family oxidoreductase n=1 Tax=Paraburkholderia hospita TaxID=169430 RepID=UPI0039BE592E
MVLTAGATGGVGPVTARGLATHGAAVAVTGLDDEACFGTATRLFRGTGKMPPGIPCDVSERGRIVELVDRALQHNGRVAQPRPCSLQYDLPTSCGTRLRSVSRTPGPGT